ncbi:MAG: stress response translation initiation inhibitor YciH [Acidobacteriota bacterium]
MARNDSSRLVYSTEDGDHRKDSPRPTSSSKGRSRPSTPSKPPRDGVVRVSRQTKGRKGKGVTLVTGVPLRGDDLAQLGGELKKQCGSGGTVKDGVIEIQGDHRDKLVTLLEKKGWTVKRAGG